MEEKKKEEKIKSPISTSITGEIVMEAMRIVSKEVRLPYVVRMGIVKIRKKE
jgi:hypothetical protein